MRKVRHKNWIILEVMLVPVLCMNIGFVFFQSLLWFNSDTAFTTSFAREVLNGNVQKGYWYCGNTSHFSALLAVPLAVLTGNDMVLQNLYQIVSILLLIVSIWFFGKHVYQNKSYILLMLILLTGFSFVWYQMMYGMVDYNQPVRMMFWGIGASYMLKDALERGTKRKIVIAASIYAIVLFIAILSGIQSLQSIVIPLIMADAFMWYIKNSDKELHKLNFRGGGYNRKAVAIYIGLGIIIIIGYFLSQKYSVLLHVQGNRQLDTFETTYPEIVGNIGYNFQGFLQFCGVQLNVPLFSFDGVLNLIKIVVLSIIIVIIPLIEIKNFKKHDEREQHLLFFAIVHVTEIAIILNFMVGPLDGWQSARYNITSYVLLISISCNFIYKHFLIDEPRVKSILVIATLSIFSLMTTASQVNLAQMRNYNDRIAEKQTLYKFLQDNALAYGYATYWNACPTTFYSNGQIKIRQVSIEEDKVAPHLLGVSYTWFDYTEYHGSKTFLLLTENEMQTFAPNGLENTELGFPESILEFSGFKILVYPFDIAEKEFPYVSKDIGTS